MWRISILAVVVLLVVGVSSVALWSPYPTTSRSFDTGTNGLWVGHRWFTGREVRTGVELDDEELDRLVDTIERRGIRYVFVHVGPIEPDGSIADSPGEMLSRLMAASPDTVFLAWLGARLLKVPIHSPEWRQAVVDSIGTLREAGFQGVHFNLEPLRDGHADYLELLKAVRAEFGAELMISQATPRSGAFGISVGFLRRTFWSKSYYKSTMALTDQTVLMAYDTGLTNLKTYVAFVRHETRLLASWAGPNHEVLIGIPSYQDAPAQNKSVENIRSATLGVRAALEKLRDDRNAFTGVAVYANWVTDSDEWADYDRYWRMLPDDGADGAAAP